MHIYRAGLSFAVTFLAAWLGARHADACTTFVHMVDGKVAIGRNYDWDMGQGLVIVNKRGVAKQAIPIGTGDRPLRWRSQ